MMLKIIGKFIAGIGLFVIGILTAKSILVSPGGYGEIVGAILATGGLIILFLPDNEG
ncbi:MAG: hypothetical protein MUP81_06130 [Dehalococcoidia bacterium]|nr:hypothetical protein [Dehalococcoidia bacterium]